MNPRSILTLLVTFLILGCNASGTTESVGVDAAGDDAGADGMVFCLDGPCGTAADCPATVGCLEAVACVEGCCVLTWAEEGTPCDDGCIVGGVCSVSGACLGGDALECVDEDGNPCTAPTCDAAAGGCVEVPLPDGETVVSSTCWDGIVCKGGQIDVTAATPTALAEDCQALDDALDPFGCVDEVICVDSEIACVEIPVSDGVQCWGEVEGQAAQDVCVGQSCQAGECHVDHALDAVCGADDYPDSCGADCQVCTALTCHWIDDPNGPDDAVAKVRYCFPGATLDVDCDDGNGCTIGDVCVPDATADGPLGKETLGLCEPGEGKSKEECLEDMDLPVLPCLKAGATCDLEGGCAMDEEAANDWCMPPAGACVTVLQAYCSYLGPDDGNWNPTTGCYIETSASSCDDANPCTGDLCVAGQGCSNDPVINGTPCGAGLICMDGVCVAGCVPDCDGKSCGDNGCGGSCGTCLPGWSCLDGDCVEACDPVNGGWTTWSCGDCNAECGGGQQICSRFCTNPVPSCGGAPCGGDDTEVLDCNTQPCCDPVNGGWSDWSCGACSEDCGGGTLSCNRTCNNPAPSCGGATCAGSSTMTEACNTDPCADYLPLGKTIYVIPGQVVTGEVPPGKTVIVFKLWGGGGGGGAPGDGGAGGFFHGNVPVSPGDLIELRVAEGGEAEGGGGGASYVFRNGVPVIIVSGGGGGGSDGCSGCTVDINPDAGQGGGGGNPYGEGQAGVANDKYNCGAGGGQGGTQAGGGAGGTINDNSPYTQCSIPGYAGGNDTGGANMNGQCAQGSSASFEKGGSNSGGNGHGGGGGSGWHGGGGGAGKWTYCGGGGGGGVGYIAIGVNGASVAGWYEKPGGELEIEYQGDAGRGGDGQTEPFGAPATDGRPGMIVMNL